MMNELTNFFLLFHLYCFTDYVIEPEDRYLLGWSFITILGANVLVQLTVLSHATVRTIKRDCIRKGKCCYKRPLPNGGLSKFELSVIAEVFESNFSSKDSDERRRAEQLSESEWSDSRLGNSENGKYKMGAIRWKDLGRKYIIKKGKRSNTPDIDTCGPITNRLHTIAGNSALPRKITLNFAGPGEDF